MISEETPIVLIGFMATGKSTVGRLLAERIGRRFVDLDKAIEAETGRSIADIFRSEGEPGFRAHERLALRRLLTEPGTVIATGGGAACQEDNLNAMLDAGLVVALSAPPEEVVRRVGDGRGRPLLEGLADLTGEARRLLKEREPFYARAHIRVDTVGRRPAEVVDELEAVISTLRGRATLSGTRLTEEN